MPKVQQKESYIQRVIRRMALDLEEAIPFAALPEDATFTLLGPDALTLETLRKITPGLRGAYAESLDGSVRYRIPGHTLVLPEFSEKRPFLTTSQRPIPEIGEVPA